MERIETIDLKAETDALEAGHGIIVDDNTDIENMVYPHRRQPRTRDQGGRTMMVKTQEQEEPLREAKAGKILDAIYEKALNGIPMVSRSVDEIVDDYLSHHDTPKSAARSLARWQVAKCGTSGFLSGLGGIVSLPVTIPANIGSVMYVQMRMIAAIAKIGGYDVNSDQVQTLVYMCLTGTTIADIVKETGIQIGEKSLTAAIKKIPGAVLTKINQKMSFRFITKFGEKGVINLGKLVPIAGGLIGGGVDIASTIVISRNAIRMFIENEALDMSEPTEEEINAAEDITIEATD